MKNHPEGNHILLLQEQSRNRRKSPSMLLYLLSQLFPMEEKESYLAIVSGHDDGLVIMLCLPACRPSVHYQCLCMSVVLCFCLHGAETSEHVYNIVINKLINNNYINEVELSLEIIIDFTLNSIYYHDQTKPLTQLYPTAKSVDIFNNGVINCEGIDWIITF